jgi:hypothetical protein
MTLSKIKNILFSQYASAAEIKEGATIALKELLKRKDGIKDLNIPSVKEDFNTVITMLQKIIKNTSSITKKYRFPYSK